MDNFLLLKEAIKSKIADNPFTVRRNPIMPIAERIVGKFGERRIERIIVDKPNAYVIVSGNIVVRIPRDELTSARYRNNMIMLKKLSQTKISSLIPRFLGEGKIDDYLYFCEQRLPGNSLDIPLKRMDELVLKAANLITEFHYETKQDITLDESNFKINFSYLFERLSEFYPDEYKEKLRKIEDGIKSILIGKHFVLVWQHGDYKIENILFNIKNWQIQGVIDWDLSSVQGLPLLDIFYLILYKSSLETRREMHEIFMERLLNAGFSLSEGEIVKDYFKRLNISDYFMRPMLVIFWLHHITVRYQYYLSRKNASAEEWFQHNVHKVIDVIRQ